MSQVSCIARDTHTFVGHLTLTHMNSHATSLLSTAQHLSLVRSRKPTKADTSLAKRIVSFAVLLGTRLRCGSSSQVSNCERQISMTESHAFGSNLMHLDQIHSFLTRSHSNETADLERSAIHMHGVVRTAIQGCRRTSSIL